MPDSSYLFALYTEWSIRSIDNMGCFKMGGTVINNISYADDIVSIAESENQLEQLMDTVVEGSDANGLFMNSAKSLTMVFLKFHGISTCKITIHCYRLDHANRFL